MSVARHDIPADSADAPIPYTLSPAAEALPRLAATSVRGVSVRVVCPGWCVTDHAAEGVAFLEDVHHYGPRVQLSVPLYGGGTGSVMAAHLALWPFAAVEDEGRTYLAVDPDGSGEVNSLYREAALAFADQLAAHAADIRRLADFVDATPRS
ncbi:DUF6907 domain-containing protein [Streptomyces sp. NPDC018019]|uniref:DUF6907 domain-containing protein n=1 Tax=Streptomyces sp. NPDC018019 TaxID=3365030 RepID=UPI00379730B1